MNRVVAIDGPAASGKGTLSRRIAAHYGFRHLDTGLTYRAVAKALIDAGQPLDDEAAAVEAARTFDISDMRRDVLADHDIGEAASKVAVMPGVRRALVERQRIFAARPPGAVLDGRDVLRLNFARGAHQPRHRDEQARRQIQYRRRRRGA